MKPLLWGHCPHSPVSQLARVGLYTSVVGDECKVAGLINYIKQIRFSPNTKLNSFSFLYPVVYKKPSKSQKSSTVDIQLTVDLLSHVHQNNLDIVFLFTGDGDFRSVVREVVSKGKRIFVGAFSDDMSSSLKHEADYFMSLDPIFLT